MSRVGKLYSLLVQSSDRAVAYRDFLAMIEAFGFQHIRTKGSHRSYAHPDCDALLVVQPQGKDAKRYQVREFLGIVEENGLSLGD